MWLRDFLWLSIRDLALLWRTMIVAVQALQCNRLSCTLVNTDSPFKCLFNNLDRSAISINYLLNIIEWVTKWKTKGEETGYMTKVMWGETLTERSEVSGQTPHDTDGRELFRGLGGVPRHKGIPVNGLGLRRLDTFRISDWWLSTLRSESGQSISDYACNPGSPIDKRFT